jgi:hypothetical protein
MLSWPYAFAVACSSFEISKRHLGPVRNASLQRNHLVLAPLLNLNNKGACCPCGTRALNYSTDPNSQD